MFARKAPRRKRAPKVPKVKRPSEHIIQSRLMNILVYALRPELECRAIPNGGLRKRRVAIQLKAEGVKPGTPDLFVALPAGRIAWLEMKTDVGSLRQEQKDFRDKVLALGHLWRMARSVREALEILTEWDALLPEFRVYPGGNDLYLEPGEAA
jgi:hypothetical protein